MQRQVCLLIFASAVSIPALGQVAPAATGETTPVEDEAQMMAPPPVSGTIYPNVPGEDVQTNYMAAELRVDTAYIDNVLPGTTATPVSDYNYSVYPTVTFNRTTPREQTTMNYSPAITFYEPTSALNTVDQGANLTFQDRLSSNVAISLRDFFLRTSNVFNESYPFTAGGITGSSPPEPAAIAPFAEQLHNVANAAVTWQFARNAMIGVGGSGDVFDLPNPSQATGLDDSTGEGAQAFYSRRFAAMQYTGVVYEYGRTVVSPAAGQVEVQSHTFLPFYTLYFSRQFSLSISAGGEYIDAAQAQQTSFKTWLPDAVASVGWQGLRGNFAASYLRITYAGDGLAGVFTSNGVNASGSWKLNRTWTTALSVSYADVSAAAQLAALTAGGQSFTAEVTLEHQISGNLTAQFGYDRLHETFNGIAGITQNPDVDRAFAAVTYEFKRALGR